MSRSTPDTPGPPHLPRPLAPPRLGSHVRHRSNAAVGRRRRCPPASRRRRLAHHPGHGLPEHGHRGGRLVERYRLPDPCELFVLRRLLVRLLPANDVGSISRLALPPSRSGSVLRRRPSRVDGLAGDFQRGMLVLRYGGDRRLRCESGGPAATAACHLGTVSGRALRLKENLHRPGCSL
jgi:hypothetical protein